MNYKKKKKKTKVKGTNHVPLPLSELQLKHVKPPPSQSIGFAKKSSYPNYRYLYPNWVLYKIFLNF